jgi:TPR repeat protein
MSADKDITQPLAAHRTPAAPPAAFLALAMSADKDITQPLAAHRPPAAPPAAFLAVASSAPRRGTVQFEEGRCWINQGPASYRRAAELFRVAAAAGHAVATAWLARCYAHGQGVEKSEAEGERLARVALDERGLRTLADQGDAAAQNAMGAMYHNGRGVGQNKCEAVAWFRKAAEQGDPEGQSRLGEACIDGDGVSKDPCEAVKLWRMAAEQGYAAAQSSLGESYRDGEGVEQDDLEAVKCWRQAAKQANTHAMCSLGEAYAYGTGVVQDHREAVIWWHQAAAQEDAAAECNLGFAYRYGEGVPKDERKAVEWFRKAAEQGDAVSQCSLGYAYRDGKGVAQDGREAAAWFHKAAEQGDADSQCRLGFVYRDGKGGVEQNHVTAVAWFRKAAEQGDADAQASLACAFRDAEGEGLRCEMRDPSHLRTRTRSLAPTTRQRPPHPPTLPVGLPRNECKAVEWFHKAASQNHELAQSAVRDWDTALADIATGWQVIYDPDPRATVVEADREIEGGWVRGASEVEGQNEAYEGASQDAAGMLRRMSPWVVRCELNNGILDTKWISMDLVRSMAEQACCDCGHDASVVTSLWETEVDDFYSVTLRVRLLVRGETVTVRDGTAGPAWKQEAGGAGADVQPQTRELIVCCPDGTSHKLAASPSTTVLEVKQHVRRVVRGAAGDAASAEEESARTFFWQDEHAVQRQHIFVHGVEDELVDARSMGSLGNPAALFLMVDTEASFMQRLQAEAAAVRVRLEGVKLRDRARCDAANAAGRAAAAAVAAAAGAAGAAEAAGVAGAAEAVEVTAAAVGAGAGAAGAGGAESAVLAPGSSAGGRVGD